MSDQLSKLKAPDTIVYYFNGQKKIFASNDPKSQKIISINNSRDSNRLNMLKSAMELDNISQSSNLLVYKYKDSAIYFPLESSDGKFIVAQSQDSSNYAQIYGYLSSPDQLLDCLNS